MPRSPEVIHADLHALDTERRQALSSFVARSNALRAELAGVAETPAAALEAIGFAPELITGSAPSPDGFGGSETASMPSAPEVVPFASTLARVPTVDGFATEEATPPVAVFTPPAAVSDLDPQTAPPGATASGFASDLVDASILVPLERSNSELPPLTREQFPSARAMHDAITVAFAHASDVEAGLVPAKPGEPVFARVVDWANASRRVAAEWQYDLDDYVTPRLPSRADFEHPAELRSFIAETELADLHSGDTPEKAEWRYQATGVAAAWEAELAKEGSPAVPSTTINEENAPSVSAAGAPST